jgi:hypothetical protein
MSMNGRADKDDIVTLLKHQCPYSFDLKRIYIPVSLSIKNSSRSEEGRGGQQIKYHAPELLNKAISTKD